MTNFIRLFMVAWMVLSSSQVSWAQAEIGLTGDLRVPQQAQEYIYRSSPRETLISVELLGAVQKPGVYYVPTNTDLVKLLTLAGGSTNGGDLSEVMIRKVEPQRWAQVKSRAVEEHRGTYEVDINQLIKEGGGDILKLNHDDLVYVPPRETWISPETSRTLTVVSVVLGIALTGLLINHYSK